MKRRATAFAAAATVLAIASSPAAASVRVLHSFSGPDGVSPSSSLVDGGDGFLYGTTFYGGTVVPDKNPDGYGTVFRVDASGAFQTVHRFDRVNGERPNGLVRGPDGLLYGTTSHGGDLDPGSFSGGQGTLFRIDGSGTLTVLHRFLPVEGLWPSAAPTFGMDGAVYGTASDDSTYPHYGTIWRWSPASGLQVLHQFNGFDGVEPLGSLTLASDGNLYGTTNGGGSGCGTVFRLSPTGVHTLLHSFSFNDGCQPKAGVIEARDGNFYGTTETGLGWGTVFRMDRAGNVTTLHAFTATGETGQKPLAPLFEASDGYLYGTTKQGGLPYGGADNRGVVFRTDLAGAVSVLHTFRTAEGSTPWSGVVEWAGGIYGTTVTGGAFNRGVVYRLAPAEAEVATLSSLALSQTTVVGGATVVGTIRLSAAAPAGGATVALASSDPRIAAVPSSVTVSAGATAATFPVTTKRKRPGAATITATYGGSTATARLTVTR